MTLQRPLITVYITNFNYGKYIEEAIQSVLNQTYPNIEILIIDDGSTDNSKEIIDRYALTTGIQTVFQSNRGLAKSNNVALAMANGEYIVRLDADDRFHSDALENLLSGFTSSSVAMVFGNWNIIADDGSFIFSFKRHNFKYFL